MRFLPLRDPIRSLMATPLVTTLAILSLALGIGANTALFSIVNSLLLRPLPVPQPERLALLDRGSWTYPIWERIGQHEGLFAGAFAWATERFDLSQGGETNFIDGAYVSGRMFQVLGVPVARGRALGELDDRRGGGADGPVAVISHRLWQGRFGGADDIVGRRLTLQRVPFTIVGVLPADFGGPDVGRVSDVMIPFGTEPLIRGKESMLDHRSAWWLEVMIRLKPDQTIEAATAALRGLQPQIREATMPPQYPQAHRDRYLQAAFTLVPSATGRVPPGNRYQPLVFVSLAVVGVVLLIACANIANLLLARAMARRQELSVRLALGASRWQLAGLLLSESLILSVAGAVLGVLFASWAGPVLVNQFATWRETIALDLGLDWRVLAFTAGLAMITAVLAGVAPAWGVTSVAPMDALRSAGRGVAGDRRFTVRGALVVAQIALSLLLVVAAALFVQTFAALSRAPLGFAADHLLVVDLNLLHTRAGAEERPALLERLREAVSTVPGVTGAAASTIVPVSGRGWNTVVGADPAPDRSRMSWMNAVSQGWFNTYGMRLLAGRDFDTRDRAGKPNVAIVNETFVRRFLAGQDPVGATVQSGSDTHQIVGVVSDAIYRSPREGMVPTMYVPLAQQKSVFPSVALTMALRPADRASTAEAVAATLKRTEPDASFTFRSFDELLAATVMQERVVAALSVFFGGLALLLAGIGVYGVMSQFVSRRRGEIGIRMALGAPASGVLALVLRRAGMLVVAGIACGVPLSWWASQYAQAMLFGLAPRDPLALAAAAGVLVGVGLLAAWLPARRAARLDPAVVLREG